MNDSMEFRWLLEIALRLVIEKRSGIDAGSALGARRWEYCDSLADYLRQSVRTDPYCACFSARGDLLSQWRAYADGGRGFAIGFSHDYLVTVGDNNPAKVLYDEAMHHEFVAVVLNIIEKTSFEQMPPILNASLLAGAAYDYLVSEAMTCKNPHFSEESEYRLVHDPSGGSRRAVMLPDQLPVRTVKTDAAGNRYVERGGNIRRFLTLPLDPTGVVRVVLGPRNPERSEPDTLRQFLWENGYRHLMNEVYQSAGTLR